MPKPSTETTPVLRADAARNVAELRRAAIDAFHGRGLDTPLEQIAIAAGVTKGTIYHRFGGRLGLIDAVIGELVGSELDAIADRALDNADPWESLSSYISDRRDLHYREPASVDALIVAYPDSQQLSALAERTTAAASRLIARARNAGVIRPDFSTPDLYFADVGNGLALRQLGRPSAEVYTRRTQLFLDGLRRH